MIGLQARVRYLSTCIRRSVPVMMVRAADFLGDGGGG